MSKTRTTRLQNKTYHCPSDWHYENRQSKDNIWKAHPLAAGAVVCATKTTLADVVAQHVAELDTWKGALDVLPEPPEGWREARDPAAGRRSGTEPRG